MLNPGLHARRWYCPRLMFKVDFGPACTNDLSGSRRSKYRELKSPCPYTGLAAKPVHEVAKLREWQCRMVSNGPLLSWKEINKVTAPRGILRGTKPMRFCPVEIASIRPLTRFAASGFVRQIGLSTATTSAVSISATGTLPSLGYAYCSRVAVHC